MIELGIGMFGDLPFDFDTKQYQKASKRLSEIIEEIKLADELGIDSFSMGEHHRADYAVSAPEIVIAALATVTKKIKLLSGVSVVSSTDPVKLFQDFVLCDLIAGNRVEIMAGRGSFIESFPLFGCNLENYHELFEEKLNLLLQLREKETISWTGKHRAAIDNQTVYPRPERKIPISIAVGGTPSSVLRAAKLGLPIVFAIIGGKPIQFQPLVEYYKSEFIKHGHKPSTMKVGVHSHTFVANSQKEIMHDYFPHYAYSMNKIGRERGWSGSYTPENFLAGTSPEGALFMGNANEVAEKIISIIETLGLQQFIAHIDVGGPSHQQIMKNIDLLGTKVFPAVRKHFGK